MRICAIDNRQALRSTLGSRFVEAFGPDASARRPCLWRQILTFAVLVAAMLGLSAHAQPQPTDSRFTVDSWGTGQGLLPDDSVLAMTQTRDGYLWLGTLNGIVRFDGVRFTVFDESNTPKLPSSQIFRLFEDSQSNLWVGFSRAGAARISQGRVEPLKIGRGRPKGHLVSICEDAAGAVWMMAEDGQLGRYSKGQMDIWSFPGVGRSVIADKSGNVFIGTATSLSVMDAAAVRPGTPLPTRIIPEARNSLDFLVASKSGGYWLLADRAIRKISGSNVVANFGAYPWDGVENIKAACEDAEGHLIVGTGGQDGRGIFWFDSAGHFSHIGLTNGLARASVYALQPDAEGNLWVGLEGGGLNRVRPRMFNVLAPGAVAQSLSPDKEGRVWMSMKDRDFSFWKDGAVQTVHSQPDAMSKFNPFSVLVDSQQRVWAAAQPVYGAGLWKLDGGVFQPASLAETNSSRMSVQFVDHTGGLWIGGQAGLFHWDGDELQTYTTSNGLSANNVHAIAEDHSGDLWIGTELGGLNRLRHGQITPFQLPGGVSSDNISALYVDADDVLWIGTMGNGLIRYKNGKTLHFWTENGLIANSIDYLVEDDQGFLWIGSNAGLMRVRKKDIRESDAAYSFVFCRGFDKRDGLPSAACTFGSQPAACRAEDGTLWFPTHSGVVYVKPSEIHSNSVPPPVVIEQVLVADKEQNTNGLHAAPVEAVTLPAGTEQLEIHYTSLNLGAADRARFRYRLSPDGSHDAKWGEASSRRAVRYETLRPGGYLFQVQACNEDGVWNEAGASLAVSVLPFFWQTSSFRALAIFVLVILIAGAVYFISTQRLQRQVANLRQQQALEKERARIARDIHDQVGASLTQLSLLGEMVEADQDDSAEVAEHARQISQTARETTHALDEIVWTVNPSNDTLDGLVNYICKHAQDYLGVAGVRYRLDAPSQLPKTEISPEARHNIFLAAKESVTNIVKHSGATEASIRLRLEPDKFVLEISDNGKGPAGMLGKAAESRNGLRNMRKRMEDVGGQFDIAPSPQGGTTVALTVPLARK